MKTDTKRGKRKKGLSDDRAALFKCDLERKVTHFFLPDLRIYVILEERIEHTYCFVAGNGKGVLL